MYFFNITFGKLDGSRMYDPENVGSTDKGHAMIKNAFGNNFFEKGGIVLYYNQHRNISIMRGMMSSILIYKKMKKNQSQRQVLKVLNNLRNCSLLMMRGWIRYRCNKGIMLISFY